MLVEKGGEGEEKGRRRVKEKRGGGEGGREGGRGERGEVDEGGRRGGEEGGEKREVHNMFFFATFGSSISP